jgi:DNA-binding transcriptional LysR family regulator
VSCAAAVLRAGAQTNVASMQGSRPRTRAPMAWDDVRLFLALCRARSLGTAAAALGVDASTVSRRLDALESALATMLFERGRAGIATTQAAEDLMPVAEEIEHAMARFASAADGLERNVSGWVRIACPPDVAEVVVVPLVPELRRKHAALRIQIDPGESVLDLTRREADLALRTVRPVRGDLVCTRLGSVRWVPAAAPELAKALGMLRSWTEAPWVAWGERYSTTAPARWLARHLPGVDPVVRSDSLVLQAALARRGVGVALLPEPSLGHYGLIPVETRAALRDDMGWPRDELFLVTHRALRQVPRVRVVWDALIERVGPRLGHV